MLVGQNLGPFAIKKELGAGAMGAVYLGVYEKTGQKLAIKVMMPGMGASEGASARFDREAAILKQMRHPNIVRLFGTGKYHGTRYYAMEFIEGETLDRILTRRQRLTWDEVVDYAIQLCAALQHAHTAGVVHRDLKPSNLMVLRDGTLKLTDFGIAKDLDVTALTGANCTVGTAAYMSPEQCRGERDISHKSDLYSLGIVLYELVTGQKPFNANNAMEMFILHDRGTFERPGRRELDMPVWLDNLICQLLEKKPEHRPLDAATVAEALMNIKDKVEAQISAGVEKARSRIADRTPGAHQAVADAVDKEAARTLLGKKKKKSKIKNRLPFYRHGWFVVLAAVLLIAFFVGALYLAFRPASPDKLYAQAEQLMEKNTPEDWDDAKRGPIADYLRHYGQLPGEQTAKIRQWKDQIEVAECDRMTTRYVERKRNKSSLLPVANSDAEKDAFAAAWAEEEGRARDARLGEEGRASSEDRLGWQKMRQQYEKPSAQARWGLYAAKRLEPYLEGDRKIEEWERLLLGVRNSGLEPVLTDELDQEGFVGYRYERFGDLPFAVAHYEALKARAAKEPTLRWLDLLASFKIQELKDKAIRSALKIEDPRNEVQRKSNVEAKLAKAEAALVFKRDDKRQEIDDARAVCLDILALYGKEQGYDELLARTQKAREGLERILREGGN